jgi:hypothetical protein
MVQLGVYFGSLNLGNDMAAVWATQRLVQSGDTYLDRVGKYVPVEVVAAYLALNGLFPTPDSRSVLWMRGFFALCWALTPIYVWRLSQGTPPKPWRIQAAMSSVAFPIWAFAIGGIAFQGLDVPKAVASALLIVFSLVAGLVQPSPPTRVRPT